MWYTVDEDMIKLTALLAFLVLPALSGDLYRHVQTPNIDAYIDNSVYTQPDLPGVGKPRNTITVSLTTADDDAAIIGVYVRVVLDTGEKMVFHKIVERVAVKGEPTVVVFQSGVNRPARLDSFYVVRFHPDAGDYLFN